jgi:hypothetical protein
MVSKDYTQEIGMHSPQRVVPLRYVLPALVAVLALSVWLGFAKPETIVDHAAKPSAAAPGR